MEAYLEDKKGKPSHARMVWAWARLSADEKATVSEHEIAAVKGLIPEEITF